MNNLAIIPARGGSKRIPRKNIKSFLGKPILSYSIEKAYKSGLFDEVMVSTDDQDIGRLSIEYGAKVPFYRSLVNANDTANTLSVIKEVISNYKTQQMKQFNFVCCIYPTAPLMQVHHLKKGYELLTHRNFYSVIPVIEFSYPVWRGFEIVENGVIKMLWPDFKNSRSQDLKIVYHDAGQWYWLNMSYINDSIFTLNTGTVILSENEAQDIDNEDDWRLAELKFKLMNNNLSGEK